MRPNGADHADATFGEALEQTQRDPELRAWFEREQAVDRALTAKLRELRAPAELRAQILQGVALSAERRSRRPFALVAAALAAAASVALVVYTALPSRRSAVSFELFVTAAVRETVTTPALGITSDSGEEVRAWLDSQSVPLPGAMPGRLGTQVIVGAGTTEWQGVRCSLLTLRVSGLTGNTTAPRADETLVHLYTVPRKSCSIENVGLTPLVATRDDAAVATWRDARNCYILVARAPPRSVQELLGPDARLACGHWPAFDEDVIIARFLVRPAFETR